MGTAPARRVSCLAKHIRASRPGQAGRAVALAALRAEGDSLANACGELSQRALARCKAGVEDGREATTGRRAKAFSAKVDTGFASENAI